MDVLVLSDHRAESHDADELPVLLKRENALLWVDVPVGDPAAARVLSEVFGFHPMAVRDCVERNHVSKFHVYAAYVFVVLHAPHVGRRGHVHYVELDQFAGRNYLVTVHGPVSPMIDSRLAQLDTGAVRHRIDRGVLLPGSPFDLSHAVVSALTRREIDLVAGLAKECGRLEQRVMLGEERDDPGTFLEQLFEIWYELLAVRTMAVHSAATYTRMTRQIRDVTDAERALLSDLADQFDLVKSMAGGQREFLHGVIEFYQTRISMQTSWARGVPVVDLSTGGEQARCCPQCVRRRPVRVWSGSWPSGPSGCPSGSDNASSRQARRALGEGRGEAVLLQRARPVSATRPSMVPVFPGPDIPRMPSARRRPWRRSQEPSELARFDDMATMVLRVRLVGGDRMDITYDRSDLSDDEELVQHVIETLSEDSGSLRGKHGDRLVVLYGRGVASIEVAPRGAVL